MVFHFNPETESSRHLSQNGPCRSHDAKTIHSIASSLLHKSKHSDQHSSIKAQPPPFTLLMCVWLGLLALNLGVPTPWWVLCPSQEFISETLPPTWLRLRPRKLPSLKDGRMCANSGGRPAEVPASARSCCSGGGVKF